MLQFLDIFSSMCVIDTQKSADGRVAGWLSHATNGCVVSEFLGHKFDRRRRSLRLFFIRQHGYDTNNASA